MTVVSARPKEPPSCTRVWFSAETVSTVAPTHNWTKASAIDEAEVKPDVPPATDCSSGNASLATKIEPVAIRLGAAHACQLDPDAVQVVRRVDVARRLTSLRP